MVTTSHKYAEDSCHFPKDLDFYRHCYVHDGVAVIENFLPKTLLETILKQTADLIDGAYHNALIGNAYLSALDTSLPKDHPQNMTDDTSLAVIAYDEIPKSHKLAQVYLDEKLSNMVAKIVGEQKLFPYACPMGALNVSVMREGDYLRWHFDQCDFVVSIPLQDPLAGGAFQYVKDVRSNEDPNFDAVKNVLLGMHPNVNELIAPCGSLIIFRGRHTIHRVTRVFGGTPRLVALLSYANTPDCDSSDHLKMIRYGRTKVHFTN